MIIGNYPAGLLSLLGAQNFGENVRVFADAISGVVDVGEQLIASSFSVQFGGSNPANGYVAAAGGLAGGIPAGEIWRVHQISASAVTGVGVTIDAWSPAISVQGNATLIADPYTLQLASQTRWKVSPISPLWLPSGTTFGIFSAGVVGAPVGSVQVLAARFKT